MNPSPNLRGKTQIKEFKAFPKLETAAHVGLRRQFDPPGRRTQLRLHAQARGRLSRLHQEERRARHVRGHDARRQDPAPSQFPRHHPRRPRRLVRVRTGIFPLQDGALSASRAAASPPQGKYYTGVGYDAVGCIAREIVDTHLDLCLDAGINHEGINAEVAKGQWEFQIFGKGSKNAADQVWVARYLLMRLCENTAWT
jgi:glutamine synthetase